MTTVKNSTMKCTHQGYFRQELFCICLSILHALCGQLNLNFNTLHYNNQLYVHMLRFQQAVGAKLTCCSRFGESTTPSATALPLGCTTLACAMIAALVLMSLGCCMLVLGFAVRLEAARARCWAAVLSKSSCTSQGQLEQTIERLCMQWSCTAAMGL